jgi:hypothetical protein
MKKILFISFFCSFFLTGCFTSFIPLGMKSVAHKTVGGQPPPIDAKLPGATQSTKTAPEPSRAQGPNAAPEIDPVAGNPKIATMPLRTTPIFSGVVRRMTADEFTRENVHQKLEEFEAELTQCEQIP